MAKINLQFTLNIQAEGEKYIDLDSADKMEEALEDMIEDILPIDVGLNYQAELKNLVLGIVVTQSVQNGGDTE